MKTRSFAQSTAVALAVCLFLASLTAEVNSQPKPESVIDRVKRAKDKQALLLEQQTKTIERIQQLQVEANQVRILAKRG
jgi:hypothetical protein